MKKRSESFWQQAGENAMHSQSCRNSICSFGEEPVLYYSLKAV